MKLFNFILIFFKIITHFMAFKFNILYIKYSHFMDIMIFTKKGMVKKSMKEYQNVFKRIEKKYILDIQKYNKLMNELEGKLDDNEFPNSTILNLYFDTDNLNIDRSKYSSFSILSIINTIGNSGNMMKQTNKRI